MTALHSTLSAQITALTTQLHQHSETIAEQNNQLTSLHDVQTQLRNEVAQNVMELQALTEERDGLITSVKGYQVDMVEMEKQVKEQKYAMKTVEEELTECKEKLDSVEVRRKENVFFGEPNVYSHLF